MKCRKTWKTMPINRLVLAILCLYPNNKCIISRSYNQYMKINLLTNHVHCHVSGSLHLDSVKSIVLDWNWRDKKFKRMTDIVDTQKDLMLLLQTYLIPHIHASKCKIGILWVNRRSCLNLSLLFTVGFNIGLKTDFIVGLPTQLYCL